MKNYLLKMSLLICVGLVGPIANAAPVTLACNYVGTDNARTQWQLDLVVDFDAGTVNRQPATITEHQIVFSRKIDSGVSITRISRVTGALTVVMDGEVLVNGQCTLAQTRKF